MRCFRCKKPGHRAAVCRAPAPVVANVTIESDVAVAGQAKNGDNHDSRLIVLSLHADGAARPVRALLDSGATNNFVLAESLLLLPADMRFNGFQGSDDFLVIELSGSFGCDFGIPWLARNQPHIDWLTRTVRPRDIDVNAVLAFLSGTPNYWPHVAVTDPDSMTTAVSGESDGPSCAACERATCAGPEPEPQDILDVHGFPHVVERELPGTTAVVKRGLPHVVKRELPEVVDAVESSVPHPDTDPTGRCRESADMIERGFPSSTAENAPRPVISILVRDGDDNVAHAREVEVARPPRDAASITQLPDLSWKHFLHDLKRGEIEQVCMIVPEVDDTVAAVEVDAASSASDTRTRPKQAEPKSAREARYAAQSLPALETSGNPVAPLVREFIEIFPEKVPGWPLPRDQTEAINAFFEIRRRAGHVRESVSPHSSPKFCVKKATGGWRIVHVYNKLNDATIPAQTPIPRKNMVLDTMSGSTQFSAIDLMYGFYQILMCEDDVPLTAVSSPSGMLWEWLVIPQGLKNAPATFNRMVSNLLRPFRSFAPSYFDDIFIHSRAEGDKTDIEVHLQHLRQVFQVMRKNKLNANLKKCIFCAPDIPVLGSYISKEGVRADPEKIEAICIWPAPQDPKELRQWLGLATYLHNYSKNFASTVGPLSQLLNVDATWSW
ncbi:hypothetical protein PC129_g12205 [Phytophthora cactorum]|uniref:Reverse transcriptase domain-containing protein n=1 Tax=Phytophthora cactorum TaxID=29920 RepID=A0A8T1HY86_9STRA|nr:hypothetical protein PC114_g11837 [Phytophthora cactorum]KAG3216949.1 hypothetical protein PC129_g12205 [Phytophthora cactorum]